MNWLLNVMGRVSSLETRVSSPWDIWFDSSASHQVANGARWCVYSGTAPTTVWIAMPNSPFDGQEVFIMSRAAWPNVVHTAPQAIMSVIASLGSPNPKAWVWSNTAQIWWKLV